MAEQVAVNDKVVSSSLTGGAFEKYRPCGGFFQNFLKETELVCEVRLRAKRGVTVLPGEQI
jgi:hypothetical protein